MDALFEMTNKGITSFKVQLPDHCNDLGVPIGPCAQCRCVEGVTLMKDELHPAKKKKNLHDLMSDKCNDNLIAAFGRFA